MPCKQCHADRQVRKADRSCNQLRKKRHSRMRRKKFRVVRKKRGMKEFQYSRSVNLRVLDGGVITMNADRRDCQSNKKQIIFASCLDQFQARASFASAASISSVSAASGSFRPCGSKIEKRPSPCCWRENFKVVCKTPRPYFTLRLKLIEDASAKYFVGHDTSPMRKRKCTHCVSIWLSKTKSSEFSSSGSSCNTRRLKARYPVWYSESFTPRKMFSNAVSSRL